MKFFIVMLIKAVVTFPLYLINDRQFEQSIYILKKVFAKQSVSFGEHCLEKEFLLYVLFFEDCISQ